MDFHIGWIIFSITLLIPGLLELYSAWKLRKYLKMSGSILPFWFSISNGIWWTLFSLLVVILAFFGKLDIQIDFSKPVNTIIVVIVVFLYLNGRIAASTQAMFLSGILNEDVIRLYFQKISNLKYKIYCIVIDFYEFVYNKFVKGDNKKDNKYD